MSRKLAFAASLAVLVIACGSPSSKPESAPAAKPAPAPVPVTTEPVKKQETPKNPDFVGHWKFEDGKAEDSSGHGHHGKVVGAVAAPGRIGGALKFNGDNAHVELPSTPVLDGLNKESYTVMAWFAPEIKPPGQEAENTSGYGIVMKTGWHEGLRFNNESKFVMEHWLGDKEPLWSGTGTWETEYEPGKFYHLAGVVDKKGGSVQIFVNGESVTSGEFDGAAAAKDYEHQTWKVGIGNPGSERWRWAAKGVIDDVRIYKKALTLGEIEAIHKAGAAGKE